MTTINNIEVTIDTTVPALSIGQVQLSADKRGTKEKPLTDAERIRRAVLPAGHWGELAASLNDSRSQSLTDVLRGAMAALASDRLKDELAANPLQRTIKLADYTITALLTWNSETAAGRGSITFTREQVEAWFLTSTTRLSLRMKWMQAGKTASEVEALTAYVSNRFATLAAKNHGLKEETDTTKLSALIDPADLDGTSAALVTEILGRLDAIGKQLKAKASEATISMDDL